MSKSNYYENALLQAIFHNIAIAGITLPAAATHLYVALHTADPGEAGKQDASEAAYTGYARLAVLRDVTGWTITNNVVNPAYNLDFPVCTASPGANITHFSVGVAAVGATEILYKGTLTPNGVMAIAAIPRVTVGTVINEE